MRHLLLALLATAVFCAPAAMAGNDDSCDISVAPAATLLLPYFEVDFVSAAGTARTTLFTVTNVSRQPQIAHVTLWTDWAYAALTFNVYLTPYGVQSINLYDVFSRGAIAPDRAVEFPALPITDPSHCAHLPTQLPADVVHDLQQIFTLGKAGTQIGRECTSRLGGVHADAIGYATVDVVDTCTSDFPGPEYFASDVLFDNVLIGDYLNIDADPATGNWATGNPMVHIRAIPEGGAAGSNPGTNLPFTFYDRFTATTPQTLPRSIDRRQPLPSAFAARWSYGGSVSVTTTYQIWREGVTGPSSTSCLAAPNADIPFQSGEIVRFDEHENSNSIETCSIVGCFPLPQTTFPATSSTPDSSTRFPGLTTSGDGSGWMYLNLNTGSYPAFSHLHRAGQNWVSMTMSAEGRFAVQFDAAAMGNGCSPAIAPGTTISPAGGAPVCPAGATGCTPGVPPYTGTNHPP